MLRVCHEYSFTTAEVVSAFDALVEWEENGVVPAGEVLLAPSAPLSDVDHSLIPECTSVRSS